MKRLKYVLTGLMIIFVAAGLFFLSRNENKGFEWTEFALDTTCHITFYGEDAKEAAFAVGEEVRRIENLMSMYKEGSDVSRVNNAEAGEKIEVSPDTYKVIKTALEISEKSGGAFDITVAPVTSLWNFTAESPKIPDSIDIKKALLAVGYENIVLGDSYTVKKLKTETKIDLGGIAKGYAGDCAAELAKRYNLTGGIIDLGGNIVCFGENPNSKDGKWRVGIQVPFSPTGTYEKIIEIDEGTVVTSGNYQRYFEKDGKIYHHIIDPGMGYPKETEYDSVTVTGKSSLEADCFATAVFVMGESGKDLAEEYGKEVYFE